MGQLMARRLAAQGANVAAVDIDDRGLAATSVRAPTITAYPCDVTDAEAVSLVVKRVEDDIGPIDRVVNAAGIARPARAARAVGRDDPAGHGGQLRRHGQRHESRAARHGRARSGDVIDFASLAGWVPVPNLGAYNASKFAVVAFSEVLAFECADRACGAVCVPTAVDTPMLDQFAGVKLFQYAISISPAAVLDAIEAGIEDGDLFVFPGHGSRFVWRLRRFAPRRGLVQPRPYRATPMERLELVTDVPTCSHRWTGRSGVDRCRCGEPTRSAPSSSTSIKSGSRGPAGTASRRRAASSIRCTRGERVSIAYGEPVRDGHPEIVVSLVYRRHTRNISPTYELGRQ